ncbi:MAG TPA: hypothetical protein VKT22_05190 [Steroidobacteraceae bacterium]|nr:hypothetical protein [Steroidobacteraceae bacterium]
MQFLVLLIMTDVMLGDYLVKLLELPLVLRFVPEALSGVLIVYVAIAGTREHFRNVAPKYWLVFGTLIVLMLCGIFNNPSGSGPVLSAMRFYLRALPMFFLPAVLPMTARDLTRQLRWLLVLALVQFPIALYQRSIVLSQGRYTGDEVRGTVMDSGVLSIFEIGAACVLTGLLLRGRIRHRWFWPLFFLVLAPTTINETKVTVFLLPLGLLCTIMIGAEPGKRLRYTGMGVAALVLFGFIFVPVYNLMEAHNPYKSQRDILNYFTNPDELARYLSSDVSGVGTKKDVRRGDAMMVPLRFISSDPARLAFGLGLGAVAPSSFGKAFEGPYFQLFKPFLITSLTFFIIECGVLGVLSIGFLHALLFFDTVYLSRHDPSFDGALAAGWSGVVVLMTVAITYTIVHEFTSVSYLFWYFSGTLCARRVVLERERPSFPRPSPR